MKKNGVKILIVLFLLFAFSFTGINKVKAEEIVCRWRYFSHMIESQYGLPLVDSVWEKAVTSFGDKWDMPNNDYVSIIMDDKGNFKCDKNCVSNWKITDKDAYEKIKSLKKGKSYDSCPNIKIRAELTDNKKSYVKFVVDVEESKYDDDLDKKDDVLSDKVYNMRAGGIGVSSNEYGIGFIWHEKSKKELPLIDALYDPYPTIICQQKKDGSESLTDCWLGAAGDDSSSAQGKVGNWVINNLAGGQLLLGEGYFYSAGDRVVLDDQIDDLKLENDYFHKLYSIILEDGCTDSGSKSFFSGISPSKSEGEYILYLAGDYEWSKIVDEYFNSVSASKVHRYVNGMPIGDLYQLEIDDILPVFSQWWRHVRYYYFADFFDEGEKFYSAFYRNYMTASTDNLSMNTDRLYSYHNLFKFLKFYYAKSPETYEKIRQATLNYIFYIHSLYQSPEKEVKEPDITEYLLNIRDQYLSGPVCYDYVLDKCDSSDSVLTEKKEQECFEHCKNEFDPKEDDGSSSYPSCLKRAVKEYKRLEAANSDDKSGNFSKTKDYYINCVNTNIKKEYQITDKEIEESIQGITETEVETEEYTPEEAKTKFIELMSDIGNSTCNMVRIKKNVDYEVNCEDYSIIHTIWLVIIIAAPFLLIIFASFDYFKIVIAGDEKEMQEAKKTAKKRFIALLILLLVPVIIRVLVSSFAANISSKSLKMMDCVIKGK